MKKISILIFCISIIQAAYSQDKPNSAETKALPGSASGDYKSWAKTPPMGWNSYNCFGAAVTEKEVRENARYMATKLKGLGWQYIVVDYCWSYPHPPKSVQNNPPQFRLPKDGAYVPWLAMDDYGRLMPDPRKFPSSVNGNGFKPLADYVHSLGLKFGIHVMRGIPKQAVWAKSPVYGVNGIDASMIADTNSKCAWLNQMVGLNMSAQGAQDYYNSLTELYASWGVDYIKMDDMYWDHNFYVLEAEAMHRAIIHSGRPMVLSLSPFMGYDSKDQIKAVANMWRMSNDFWDKWELLKHQFELADQWNSSREPGNWPDADMLQIGRISRRGPAGPERESRFTEDEMMTHIFFWCIIKSPLMMGGDMTVNTPFVERLLTNPELMAVDQSGENPRRIFSDNGKVAWCSDIPGTKGKFCALFNLNDDDEKVTIPFKMLGMPAGCTVRDIWDRKDLGSFKGEFGDVIKHHGTRILRIMPK